MFACSAPSRNTCAEPPPVSPIQATDVPTNVKVTDSPGVSETIAAPALHDLPAVGAWFQDAVNCTEPSVSSTRGAVTGTAGGGVMSNASTTTGQSVEQSAGIGLKGWPVAGSMWQESPPLLRPVASTVNR